MRKLRPLVLAGVVLAAASFGCESKNPVGPGTVSVSRVVTTTTTTSIVAGRRYVAFAGPVNVPSDMTLFFEPVQAGGAEAYGIFGLYRMNNGTTGEVRGRLTGSPDSGQFSGTLTATVQGCTAEREFSGLMNNQYLQWTGGMTTTNCPGNPLAFEMFTLLRSELPPPTTTAEPTTTVVPTTTTVVADLRTPDFLVSPSGIGLMSATVFTFQYDAAPVGGKPPFNYVWNFGDGTGPGAGTGTSHVFNSPGTFTVIATVTDASGQIARDQATVSVKSVTGTWDVAVTSGGVSNHALNLTQTQSQVLANLSLAAATQVRSGIGSVSNPRGMVVAGLEVQQAGTTVSYTYNGVFDGAINKWEGTLTGPAACPSGCTFTATRR